jgi:hypothetical protein
VVRPYKTRDAFTNLSSSPPTIYLNEYLIDDEEILEYLILRELIHIKLHMYPPMRYCMPNMSYAEKFESNLYFLIPKEKVEEVKERIFKKTDRGEPEASVTSFFLFIFLWGPASCSAAGAKGSSGNVDKGWEKRGLFACRYIPRDSLTGLITPVSLYLWGSTCRCWLLRPFHTAGRPLRSVPRGISWQVFMWLCTCRSLPVESKAYIAKQKKRHG